MKKLLCSLFALSAVSTAMAQEVNIKILVLLTFTVALYLGAMAQT